MTLTPRLCIRINSVLLLAAATWFLLAPALIMPTRLADPALRYPGRAPACTWTIHRTLSSRLPAWADARVAAGTATRLEQFNVPATEWPIFTCVFFLGATEALQNEWILNHPADAPDAPAVYAREAIRAAAALAADPRHHTWVRNYWGKDYLRRENVFFRSLLIAAFTRYEALTGDRRYHDELVDLADSLADDLDRSPHGLLDDYPDECYPIDIVAAIGWIRDSDRVTGRDHRAFADRARRAFTGPLAVDGLPAFRMNSRTLMVEDTTRGTGNSWSLVFAPHLWPDTARDWTDRYTGTFWQNSLLARGFREYPPDAETAIREWGFEVDAGPIVAGFSPAANAFGLAAMRACGRFDLAWPLAAQSLAASLPLPNGRLATAAALSDRRHAPLLGEAALLSFLTTQPAPGMPVRTGSGCPPPVVFLLPLVGLLLFVSVLLAIRQRARYWDAPTVIVPLPRLQITLWILAATTGIVALLAGWSVSGAFALLLMQGLPRPQ